MAALELSYHEEMDGMWYPNLTVVETEQPTLGKYGIMAMEYLKENHYPRYRLLVRLGRLHEKMKDVEEEANRMQEQLMEQYLKKHKPDNPHSTMEMWKIREQGIEMAEEIVINEIINRYH